MRSGSSTPQPNLFDPDDRWNEPVPFHLSARGRRLVDPSTPDLRVVTGPDGRGPRDSAPAAVPPDTSRGRRVADRGAAGPDDARVDAELEGIDGPDHARVRALRRAGTAAARIAAQVDLEPLTLAVFRATDPPVSPTVVAPGSGGRERTATDASTGLARQADAGVGSAVATASATPVAPAARDAAALALIAAVGEVDATGLGVTTNRIVVAAALVSWLRQDRGVRSAAMRVVLRVADVATADLVAAAWADRLGLGRDRVATVAWRTAPGPRDVQAVIRVTDRGLASDLASRLDGWSGR